MWDSGDPRLPTKTPPVFLPIRRIGVGLGIEPAHTTTPADGSSRWRAPSLEFEQAVGTPHGSVLSPGPLTKTLDAPAPRAPRTRKEERVGRLDRGTLWRGVNRGTRSVPQHPPLSLPFSAGRGLVSPSAEPLSFKKKRGRLPFPRGY